MRVTLVAKGTSYDLWNPPRNTQATQECVPLQKKHQELRKTVTIQRKSLLAELKDKSVDRKEAVDLHSTCLRLSDVVRCCRGSL